MQLLRVVRETSFASANWTDYPYELIPRLVTAEIATTNGKPLFKSCFFAGTPARSPALRNEESLTEEAAILTHDRLCEDVRRGSNVVLKTPAGKPYGYPDAR